MRDHRTTSLASYGEDLPRRLAPIGNILAMLHDYYRGDADGVRTWLMQPQKRLGNQSPLDALRVPGTTSVIEQWIVGLWLGDGE